jgi:hypothetical protein
MRQLPQGLITGEQRLSHDLGRCGNDGIRNGQSHGPAQADGRRLAIAVKFNDRAAAHEGIQFCQLFALDIPSAVQFYLRYHGEVQAHAAQLLRQSMVSVEKEHHDLGVQYDAIACHAASLSAPSKGPP